VSPTAALFVVELGLLIGALVVVAAVVLWILDRLDLVDLGDDAPTTCPCIDAKPCAAHPWRYDFDAVPPRPWKPF
jgi:hypothetical protein